MAFSPTHILSRFSCLLLLLAALAGCGRFSTKPPPEYVYVSAKGTYLRDRLAAVSNRVGQVSNGQKLLVLGRARRFVKVKTDKGEIGWLDERAVIDQPTFDKFKDLGTQHAHDPVIVAAVLRDDAYLHLTPGRQTEHYYLLPENTKFQLLARASVPKPGPPQAIPLPKPKIKSTAEATAKSPAKPANTPPPPPAPVLQDWYLVRDSQGRTGWVWAHMLDVDIPNEISGLAEGQKYVGAYVLRTVDDPESSFPNGKAPEYLALMNSWKEGLPWDFDQVRVFTWNTKRHRYETAFRQRNLQGYLPVTTGTDVFNKQTEPVFSYRISTDDDIAIDPQTGAAHPAHFETETYRMEGVLVKKVEPPSATPPPPPAAARPAAPAAQKKHKAETRHKKRH
jgi:uncharacterized protein YgiM (DUF1202 family)